MNGWLASLSPDLRELLTAAAGDAPLGAWTTAKRPELAGLSVQQALDDPRTAPTAIAWLSARARALSAS